jgi:NCS2 family nucleobase:cation symporter-2
MIIIAEKYGLQAVYGAMLAAGVFGLIIAKPFSMLIRFFPPLVAGTVICVIGLSLIGADVGLIAGSDPTAAGYGKVSHIGLAALVMLLIVVITRVFSGFISQIAVLLSIVIGTLVAWPMGLLDFSSVKGEAWLGFSGFFRFGHPKFEAAAIISMCIVIMVTYTKSTADMLAVAKMVDKDVSPSDLARGLATDGLSAVLAGFMNSFPDTAFAQNVGLIGLTRVRSRWVVTTCGVFLVILGLVPKFGQVVAHVPGPVIGGAATVMFAMVTAVGIRTLNKASFDINHNLLIVAVSLSAGLIPAGAPTFYNKFPSDFQVIFGSSITSTVIVVFVLNIVFNHWTWRQPRTESTVRRRSGAMPSSSISPTAECIRTPGTASSARKASPPGKASPQVSGVG